MTEKSISNFNLDIDEVDIIRHALILLDRDMRFDSETFSRNDNLNALQHCLDTRSQIKFLLLKIKF